MAEGSTELAGTYNAEEDADESAGDGAAVVLAGVSVGRGIPGSRGESLPVHGLLRPRPDDKDEGVEAVDVAIVERGGAGRLLSPSESDEVASALAMGDKMAEGVAAAVCSASC